jgi:hypothetical protein
MLTAAEMAQLFAKAGAGAAPAVPDTGPPPGRALLAEEAREGPATGRRVRPPVAAGPPGKGLSEPRVPSRPCDDAQDALARELKGRRGC